MRILRSGFNSILICGFLIGSGAVAQEPTEANPKCWTVELGFLSLTQTDGGNTSTLLPMFNFNIWTQRAFAIHLQAGATVYKDAPSDGIFSISVLRLTPLYKISGTKFSVEALLGFQQWEGKGAKSDFGARLNFASGEVTHGYIDEVFGGGGSVLHEQTTNYLTFGFKKWF